MSNSYFEFKKFTVQQDKCAMKVGTDGVLLGGWSQACGNLSVLDIGTGTGIIALMMAQTTTGMVYSVELDADAAQQASENFKASSWSDRLYCYNTSVQELAKRSTVKYDLIVSNPPFFIDGVRSANEKRAQARHADNLDLKQLVEIVSGMLNADGHFGIILPYSLRTAFIRFISRNGLWLHREARVRPLPNEKFARIMFEIVKNRETDYSIEEIVIENGDRHNYAPSFLKYTENFYR